MLRDWLRGRAALAAELYDTRAARDQLAAELHTAEAANARLTKQRNHLGDQLDEARRALLRERRDRAVAEETTIAMPAVVTRADLLKERARADALAQRVDQLQHANMAMDRPAR
ncbi:hypothetical protein [Nonomuraea lactucae]|uniref:hypothetical protein n=1 Tax=Nonomuraea lactucae TaxID=2249762 RepID=UPI0013B36626|nr:hypothetical protein [Nonomuraea lactucae]